MKVNFLYETDKESIKTYYKMKNKLHYSFNEEEKALFVENAIEQFKNSVNLNDFDTILIPETKNESFKKMVECLNIRTVILKKNSKQYVLEQLVLQKMMKEERAKLIDNINQMEDVKIGLIAANQRMRVASLLFNVSEDLKDKKVLFMDDSMFTGATFKAILQLIDIKQAFVLFSNQD